jgi:Phage protein Gp138 N-terminal domain
MPPFALTPGQRVSSGVELVDLALAALEQRIRVSIPCVVVSFNAAKQTVVAQQVLNENVRQSGKLTNIPIKPLADIPIVIPRAGGVASTLPINPGDECLVVFADMCIDSWWQSGGTTNNQIEKRRHDLSDGIAIFGLWSQPRVLPNYSQSAHQTRSDDGTSYIDFAKGQTTITDNAVIKNGFTGHIASNTGQITSFHDGIMMNLDSVGSLNLAYFESQLARIAASQDCNDLNLQSTQMLATLNKSIASITTLISQLAPLIVAPTDLPSVITWATNMIAPMLLAHTNCITQLSALSAKLSALESAVAARQAALGCS